MLWPSVYIGTSQLLESLKFDSVHFLTVAARLALPLQLFPQDVKAHSVSRGHPFLLFGPRGLLGAKGVVVLGEILYYLRVVLEVVQVHADVGVVDGLIDFVLFFVDAQVLALVASVRFYV